MARITKRERMTEIATILAGLGETELAEFAEGEVALLEKRAGKERKATKTQIANEAMKGEIVDMLTGTEGMTATEIAVTLEVSVQKVAQLMKQLVEAETVTRTEGKGKVKTTFTV